MITNEDHFNTGTAAITDTNETHATSRAASAKPVSLFSVVNDREYFTTVMPEKVQDEVNLLLGNLKRIHAAKNKTAAIRQLAALPENRSRRGYSAKSLERKYYAYVKSGDWRDLVDRTKAPAEKSGMPGAFIAYFKMLCEQNQRCCSQAIRELLVIWRTRHTSASVAVKAIPGYAEWPVADPRTGVPEGWTERNLYRYLPDIWSLTAARIGRAAASAHRLKVHRTRVGLRLMEFVQMDDHEYNLKINFAGQWKAMRPRGFTAVDVLSASPFAKSFKPTLWDDVDEKKQALTERDAAWFTIHILCTYGYRTDERGTCLNVEHGTMALREQIEQRIHDATGGKVRVERGGIFGKEGGGRLQLHDQFRGQGKGNFRFKALIESFWNLIDNYLAHLPGQVGKDRNHAPDQIYGADLYNNKLLKLEAVLPPQIAAQLKKPYYTWAEFLDAALRCYTAIDHDPGHACEGWEKCGFEAKEWRLQSGGEWLPYDALIGLDGIVRQATEALVLADPLLHRVRRMSRAEVFARGRAELTPLPAYEMPTLMGLENALRGGEPLTVKSGELVFEDKDFGPGEHRYVAQDTFGQRLTDKYICFVNPFNPSVLVACDAKLRVKGLCPPALESCHNDVAGIKRQLGATRAWEANAIRESEVRHADAIKAKAALHEHNGNVLAGRPLSGEKQLQREEAALADLADQAILANIKNHKP